MNKLAMIGFLLIAFIGISTAGEILGGLTDTIKEDIVIDYPTEKIGTELTETDMKLFDGLEYEVKGNNIILNKKGVYDNKVISFEVKQTCLEWIQPTTCITFNKTTGECSLWESMLFTEIQCKSWTKFDTNYFISQAIKNELEGLKGIQTARINKVIPKSDYNGIVSTVKTKIIEEPPIEEPPTEELPELIK